MNNTTTEPTTTTVPESPASPDMAPARERRPRKRHPCRPAERPDEPLMLPTLQAAAKLSKTPEALRALLGRYQVKGANGKITSPIGPGIVGFKIGGLWYVQFDVAR